MSLLTNILAYWKFDESSGNASDATGNGYTLTNNAGVTYSAAVINNGANFASASTQYFNSTAAGLGLVASDFTIAFWIKPVSLAVYNSIITKYTGGSFGYNIWADGGGVGLIIGSTNVSFTARPGLSTSAFTHIVITQSGTSVVIYKNGSSFGTGTGASVPSSSADFQIGLTSSYGTPMNGVMDETGIWTRALSAGEVSTLYNSGHGLQYPFGGSGNASFLMNFL